MRQLRDQNTAFLMKLGYNIVATTDALWVRVICSKYGMKESMLKNIARGRSSFLWKAISKVWPLL